MTRRNWTAIATAHALEEYRERASDVDYPCDRPKENDMADPKLMAAQLRAWSNVLRLVAATLAHPTDPPHTWHLLVDLEKQMRTVAEREERR